MSQPAQRPTFAATPSPQPGPRPARPTRCRAPLALSGGAALLALTACTTLPRIIATNDTTTTVDLQIATPHPPPGSIQSPSGYFRVKLRPGEGWDSRRDARQTFMSSAAPWGISGEWVFIATTSGLLQGDAQTAEARLRAPKPTTLRIETRDDGTLGITTETMQP